MTIVLPKLGRWPVGGYKITHEYGNWLARFGNSVSIVHAESTGADLTMVILLRTVLRSLAWRLFRRHFWPWVHLERGIDLRLVPSLRSSLIPDADAVIATAWQTAEKVRDYPTSKGKKFYLVYDYEFFVTADEPTKKRMAATYRADLTIISGSSVVTSTVLECGGLPRCQIAAGIDLATYKIEIPIELKRTGTVGFPIRHSPLKGTDDAIEAVTTLHTRWSHELHIKAFGPVPRPRNLPKFVDYWRYDSDRGLAHWYISISIFLFPSLYEGWGLPGAEAMACGAALVTTDSGGIRDYAHHSDTALVVPPRQPISADAVQTLLRDDALRQRLAWRGNEYVQAYTWAAAADQLRAVLQDVRETQC